MGDGGRRNRAKGPGATEALPAQPAPSPADSWERHAKIADLVQKIRRTRGLRLSPERRPPER